MSPVLFRSALALKLGLGGWAVLLTSEGVLVGVVGMSLLVAAWVVLPLEALWKRDRERRSRRQVTDEGIRRLEERGASPELLQAARRARRTQG